MRKIFVLLVITLAAISFLSIACTNEAPAKKTDNADTEKVDTQIENQTTDTVTEGVLGTSKTDTITGEEVTPADAIEEGVVVSSDGIESQTSSDTTEGIPGVSTRIEEDGSVTIIDSTGNVVVSKSINGTTETVAGTSTGLTAADDVQTPADTVKAEETKIINSRGDVNIKDKIAIMKTNFGDIHIFFFDDPAPNHVRNFLYLAEKDFFTDVKFHRIKPDFMAQGGKARPDWTENIPQLKLEVDPSLVARHRRGALSAARTSDLNSATSQFFLVFSEAGAKSLDGKYTVYGQVFKGFDTIDKLEAIKVAGNPQMRGEVSLPLEDVYIISVVVEDIGPYQADVDKWKEENGL